MATQAKIAVVRVSGNLPVFAIHLRSVMLVAREARKDAIRIRRGMARLAGSPCTGMFTGEDGEELPVVVERSSPIDLRMAVQARRRVPGPPMRSLEILLVAAKTVFVRSRMEDESQSRQNVAGATGYRRMRTDERVTVGGHAVIEGGIPVRLRVAAEAIRRVGNGGVGCQVVGSVARQTILVGRRMEDQAKTW